MKYFALAALASLASAATSITDMSAADLTPDIFEWYTYDWYLADLEGLDEDLYLDEGELAYAENQWNIFVETINTTGFDDELLADWMAATITGTATDNQAATPMTYDSLNAFLEKLGEGHRTDDVMSYYDSNGDGELDLLEQ